MTHSHDLIEAKINMKTSQKIKPKKNRNFDSLFKSKWTMKHIVSFP